jgi:hypothetical protein
MGREGPDHPLSEPWAMFYNEQQPGEESRNPEDSPVLSGVFLDAAAVD